MSKSKHDRMSHNLAIKPSLIRLDNIVISTEEAHLFNTKNKDYYEMVREPDSLMFDPSTQTLYNIEYKCTGCHRDEAIRQVRDCGRRLSAIFVYWKVRNLYVHGDYEVEEIL